jgi:glycosyltransferase involved in cell wall biosynthesis
MAETSRPGVDRQEGGRRPRGLRKTSPPATPLVSIITVVFNGYSSLEQTILSVTGQSYGNIEYLIIDGGSGDGTLDIIRKYDDKIDYWISEPDNGIFDAMNKGIKLATGELIGIINCGDRYLAGAVHKIVEAAAEHPEADVFHGDLRFIQKSGIESVWRSRERLNRRFIYRMPVNHPTVFVRSACYRAYGVFDTLYRVAADFDLMLRFLVDRGLMFHHIDAVLAVMSGGGASGDFTRITLGEITGILKKRNVPALALLLCRLKYTGLMLVDACKQNALVAKVFSWYYRFRLRNTPAQRHGE